MRPQLSGDDITPIVEPDHGGWNDSFGRVGARQIGDIRKMAEASNSSFAKFLLL